MLIDLEQIQHKHLAERVYEEVRDRILRRALTTDEQIPVDQIAAELDVSRTPVLDAVKRLAAEGLVEVRARRGSFVRGLTDTDVREIFQIREAIEVFGVRNAIAEGRYIALAEALEVWIARMDATVADGAYRDYLAFSEADRGFHQAIVASCGNGRMAEMYATLSVHVHIMRVHLLRAIEGPDRIQAQHTALAAAVRAADVEGAQAAVITHLSQVRDRMVVRIADHGGSL